MRNSFSTFLACVVLAFSAPLEANTQSQDSPDQKLTSYLEDASVSFEVPAIALAITTRTGPNYARAVGVLQNDAEVPADAHTLFHMASVSKPMVATALMHLQEQGFLNIDERVVTYLPYFKMGSGSYDQITLRQMLSHVSGMPDEEDFQWEQPRHDEGALEDYVRGLAAYEMIASPEETRAYSNIAYEVLGDVIAKVSGMSFEDYMQLEVLRPLHMSESTYKNDVANACGLAMPHVMENDLVVRPSAVFPYHRAHAPSSSLYASALDMSKWLGSLLALSDGVSNAVISSATHGEMVRAHFAIAEEEVGLGWMLGEHDGEQVYFHEGADVGFSSFMMVMPKSGIGIAIMGNSQDVPINRLIEAGLSYARAEDIPKFEEPVSQSMLRAYRKSGVEAAIEAYQAIASDPRSQVAADVGQITGFGRFLFGSDHGDAAHEIFLYTDGLFPTNLRNLSWLARSYVARQEQIEARKVIQRMLDIDPENRSAKKLLSELDSGN